MLPIYTRFLTPSDYGIIELLSMVLDLVGIILGLRVGVAIFRYYSEYSELKDKNEVITTSLFLLGALNLIGVFALVAAARPLSLAVFGEINQAHNLMLFSFTLLMQGFIEVPMVDFRARQQPRLYVMFSIIKLILQLSLNILFVVYLKMGVEGVIYSAVLSSLILGAVLTLYTIHTCGIRFSPHKARQLISFSFPLVLTSLISFYITFGDRYFLRVFGGGLQEVGVYSLAYKFGFLLMFLIVNPFNNIWDTEKYNVLKKQNPREEYQSVFIVYSTILLFVCLILSLFIKDILRIMSTPPFWGAAQIVPVVLFAYLTNAWCEYVNLGFMLERKTFEFTYWTLLSGVVITFGYFYLIPRFGAMGAAWATVSAFALRCVFVYWRAKRFYDMGLQWWRVCLLFLFFVGLYLMSMNGPSSIGISLMFKTMILVVAVIGTLILPILPPSIRERICQVILDPVTLFKLLLR
jgi:O-antigen/teichoic acid export membrane protein